ncbi:MAG: OB-fold domain-containing protein [Psychrobacillus sp.]
MTKKYICPKCLQGKMEETEVLSRGEVYSFTEVHIAPAEFEHLAPYNVVLVQLSEAQVKVTTRILEPVQIGDVVELEKIENGAYVYKKIG